MNSLREIAYRIDPVLWVREVLGLEPARVAGRIPARAARRLDPGADGATGRQDHRRPLGRLRISCCFTPGGLSVIACPAQRQSAEAVRRVRESLIKIGAELKVDNVYGLELKNGSRVLALPGSDDFDPWADGGWLDRGRRGRPP